MKIRPVLLLLDVECVLQLRTVAIITVRLYVEESQGLTESFLDFLWFGCCKELADRDLLKKGYAENLVNLAEIL